jgi:hypothetical protein
MVYIVSVCKKEQINFGLKLEGLAVIFPSSGEKLSFFLYFQRNSLLSEE